MAVKVWDRDEFVKMAREREHERRQQPLVVPRVRVGFWRTLGNMLHMGGEMVMQAGMYSSDPTTARMAITYNAERALRAHAAVTEQRRVEDAAARRDEMRILAEEMVEAMDRRVRERR